MNCLQLFLALIIPTLAGCSLLQRSPASRFGNSNGLEISPYEQSFERSSGSDAPYQQMDSRRRGARFSQPRREYASIIQDRDIVVGMDKDSVRESWGEPRSIDISGHPSRQNERWTYIDYLATPEGFQPQQRTLYFEQGELIGWRTD